MINNLRGDDYINFYNSNFSVENLLMEDVYADAIDSDFSTGTIDNLIIKKAGNDCLDLSFGNYQVERGEFIECNDKGISVGEKSKTKIYETSISNSNIAIAAKDGSEIFVGNSIATKITNFCLAAYNKKSEFNGAEITYKNFQCDKNNYFDNFSIIKNEQD